MSMGGAARPGFTPDNIISSEVSELFRLIHHKHTHTISETFQSPPVCDDMYSNDRTPLLPHTRASSPDLIPNWRLAKYKIPEEDQDFIRYDNTTAGFILVGGGVKF